MSYQDFYSLPPSLLPFNSLSPLPLTLSLSLSLQAGQVHSPTPDELYYEVDIAVEVLEDDGKGILESYELQLKKICSSYMRSRGI